MNTNNFLFELRDLHFDYSPACTFSTGAATFKRMPNNEKFNRNNRYETVFLINALQQAWDLSAEDCEKIEWMVKMYLPETEYTQLEVTDWLVLHWNAFNSPSTIAKAV